MKKTIIFGLLLAATSNTHSHTQPTYHEKKAAYAQMLHEVMRNTPPELEHRLRSRFDQAAHIQADAFLVKEFKEFCQENQHRLSAPLQKLYSSLVATEQELYEAEKPKTTSMNE